jgi:hypothetical protein
MRRGFVELHKGSFHHILSIPRNENERGYLWPHTQPQVMCLKIEMRGHFALLCMHARWMASYPVYLAPYLGKIK